MFQLSRLFKLQLAKMWADPMIFMFIFIQPLIFSMLFGYLFQNYGGNKISIAVFFGVAQMAMWQALLYSGGVIVRHEFNRDRTLPYNLMSSTNLLKIWAVRLAACVIFSTPAIVMTLIVGGSLFNIEIGSEINLVFVGLIVYAVSLFSLGLPLILLLFLNPHGGKVIQTVAYPIFLLSGMIVSIDHFPAPIKMFSLLFPITWSTKFIQELFSGGVVSLNLFFGSLGTSIIYLFIAGILYLYIIRKVKEMGEMNL